MPRAGDLAGCVLDGRYELHAVIGEGTFGRVYRGVDRRLARTVAVKVIKPWWTEDARWGEAFEREARLLARVTDPGIVQIFDVGHAPEGLYFVAEFVDGDSLAGLLGGRPLPPSRATEIAEQLCRALAGAHKQGIVHRDIKPANVLISGHGQVKLTDFSVARLAEGTTEGGAGTVVGTPRYMAPEQARGLRTTPATDVYGVGVVLYEMLAGRPPFAGRSAVDLALRHLNDPPPALPPGTPAELVEIVGRALSKAPGHRYSDGQAMAEALRRAQELGVRPEPAEAVAVATAPAALRTSNAKQPVGARVGPPRGPAGGRSPRERAGRPPATRVAPRRPPRRNVNPAGRRRSVAAIAVAALVLVALIIGAIALAGPGQVRLPSLRGLDRSGILARARGLGVTPVFSDRHDSAKAGLAIAQAPAAGSLVDKGSVVQVTLSSGPPPVKLPSLVGQSSTSATAILHSLGLSARISQVPAPGVRPGTVTGQVPSAGRFVRSRSSVSLSAAETPRWRVLTTASGTDAGQSVPFRIRGSRWRIVEQMNYVGTCTLLFYCNGPSAEVFNLSNGASLGQFDLSDGDSQMSPGGSGPGLYQVKVTPGSDTASWRVQVEDYY